MRYINKECYSLKEDPFIHIINSHENEMKYSFGLDLFSPRVTKISPGCYDGVRKIFLHGKIASFEYKVKRTGETKIENPWYEFAEIESIRIIDNPENTLEYSYIDQILSLQGQKILVPTVAAIATEDQGVLKAILQACRESTEIPIDEEDPLNWRLHGVLARELIDAFKKEVQRLMPGALA